MIDAPEKPGGGGRGGDQYPPVRLLIVGDSRQAREMTRFYVRELAGEIRECEGGAGDDVLETVAEFAPGWVLMEVYLRETDGFALIRRISEADPATRIVVVTNRTDEQTRRAAIAAGAFAFFGMDDLMALTVLLKSTKP